MDNLRDKISEDLKTAMKARDKLRTSVLRMLLAEIMVAEKSGKDFKYVDVLKGYSKKLKKAIEEYKRLGSADKVCSLEKELEIAQEFLPEQMSEGQLVKIIDEIIALNKFTSRDMGRVIKLVMEKYGDAIDGKQAQAIVKDRLQS